MTVRSGIASSVDGSVEFEDKEAIFSGEKERERHLSNPVAYAKRPAKQNRRRTIYIGTS